MTVDVHQLFDSLSELFEHVRQAVNIDHHSKALRLLKAAAGQPDWTDEDREVIRNKIVEVEQQQAQRFQDELQFLRENYLKEPLQPVGTIQEMQRVEERLARLHTIFAQRDLQEIDVQVKRLREITEVERAYLNIAHELNTRLDQATGKSDVSTARKILSELTTQVLPTWEQQAADPTNHVANIVVARLRDLVDRTNKIVQALAKRNAVLTTQAGLVNFWAIEEEYQRWITPTPDDPLAANRPTRYPQMVLKDVTNQDGQLEQRYIADGQELPLPEWHDLFLGDAAAFAKRKGEEKLILAQQQLEAGQPFTAQATVGEILEGNRTLGTPPLFNLPAEIRQRAEEFLSGEELRVKMARYTSAQTLLHEADALRTHDLPGAWSRYRQALSERLDLSTLVRATREDLLERVIGELIRQMRSDRTDQDANTPPEYIRARLEEVRRWLDQLPDYDTDPELARKLDPDERLRPVRRLMQAHWECCRLWSQLASLQRDNAASVKSIDTQLQNLAPQITRWVAQLPSPAGESGALRLLLEAHAQYRERWQTITKSTPDEVLAESLDEPELPIFQLYRVLAIRLRNEQNAEAEIDRILHNTDIFPSDPAQTNATLLKQHLTAARQSSQRQPVFVGLVATLEARDALYQEQQDGQTVEGRISLIKSVLLKKNLPATETAIAELRLKELEQLLERKKKSQEKLDRAVARADLGTLDGFKRAWKELEEALETAPREYLPSVTNAQKQIRTKAEARARKLSTDYSGPLGSEAVTQIRAWLELIQRMGAAEAEQTLHEEFNRRLWRWEAENGATLWDRFSALARLAEAEPNANWKERAHQAGSAWLIDELEQIRRQLAQGVPAKDEQRPEAVLARIDSELRSALRSSAGYKLKATELYVWLSDLPNARSQREQLSGSFSPADGIHSLLRLDELDLLLQLADLYDHILTWQQSVDRPDRKVAEELKEGYDKLLRN